MNNTPKFVRPGDPIRAAQFNDLQRALGSGLGQSPPGKGLLKSGFVFVKNTTGAAVKRYSTYSLGDSIWTLDRHRNLADCVFNLVAYDAAKPVAVLQQPLPAGEIGLAVVDGSTLVECNGSGTTTDLYATPQSDGRVQASSTGPIRLTQARPTGGGFVLGIIGIGGGSSGRIFKTPNAGIPPAVGSTWGTATCTEYDDAGIVISGSTATIYNHRTSIIPGNVFILVLAVGEKLFAWEGNCPEVIAPP